MATGRRGVRRMVTPARSTCLGTACRAVLGEQVNFLKRYGGWRRIANPSQQGGTVAQVQHRGSARLQIRLNLTSFQQIANLLKRIICCNLTAATHAAQAADCKICRNYRLQRNGAALVAVDVGAVGRDGSDKKPKVGIVVVIGITQPQSHIVEGEGVDDGKIYLHE